jgi:hypothetical protein
MLPWRSTDRQTGPTVESSYAASNQCRSARTGFITDAGVFNLLVSRYRAQARDLSAMVVVDESQGVSLHVMPTIDAERHQVDQWFFAMHQG